MKRMVMGNEGIRLRISRPVHLPLPEGGVVVGIAIAGLDAQLAKVVRCTYHLMPADIVMEGKSSRDGFVVEAQVGAAVGVDVYATIVLRDGSCMVASSRIDPTGMTEVSFAEKETDRRLSLMFTVLRRLVRGGLKAVPVFGVIIEEVLFGTLDERETNRRSKELHDALARITQSRDEEKTPAREVLSELRTLIGLPEEAQTALSQLARVCTEDDLRGGGMDVLAGAVERVTIRYRAHESSAPADAVAEAVTPIGLAEEISERDQSGDNSLEGRIKLMGELLSLGNDELKLAVAMYGGDAVKSVPLNVSQKEAIAYFISWIDGRRLDHREVEKKIKGLLRQRR